MPSNFRILYPWGKKIVSIHFIQLLYSQTDTYSKFLHGKRLPEKQGKHFMGALYVTLGIKCKLLVDL